MENFKIILEYDGTEFHGWQKQPGVRTIQGVVEAAAEGLFGRRVRINGCCRTDAGVHAWGFAGNFGVDTTLDADRVRAALNAMLPSDVVVRDAAAVAPGFHARHDCVARRYVYRMTTFRTAVYRRFVSYTKYPLSLPAMERAAGYLTGKQDFTSFAPASLDDGIRTECHVMETRLRRENGIISFDIKADRFLHHMVRNIVGTLIEVGRGRFNPEQVGQILCKKDRRAAGPTAPACGLALVEAYYPE